MTSNVCPLLIGKSEVSLPPYQYGIEKGKRLKNNKRIFQQVVFNTHRGKIRANGSAWHEIRRYKYTGGLTNEGISSGHGRDSIIS